MEKRTIAIFLIKKVLLVGTSDQFAKRLPILSTLIHSIRPTKLQMVYYENHFARISIAKS
ncbi:MAG: hypothetical protein C5B59_13040 [Bacteroidetes bacterium]|nr:MAG: hypothetical protein C5B59_13040 [Bacteroidota bacterium]